MDTATENGALIEYARTQQPPHRLDIGHVYAVATADGDVEQIDLTGDLWRDRPRHKAGLVIVRDAPSWLAYWAKHSTEASEVYANREGLAVVAVLDAHGREHTDWGQHRVMLQLAYSDPFKAWQAIDGKQMSQEKFAEHIEDMRPTIIDPAAADILELVQTFYATRTATIKGQSVLKTGQRAFSYVEDIQAGAGQRGEMTIPDHLTLALPVFDGAAEADSITARLRFRIAPDGRLALGVILDQLVDVVNGAFWAVIEEIVTGVGDAHPVMRGKPA